MPWKTQFDPDTGILEIIFSDVCSPQDLAEAVLYSIEYSVQHGVLRFLADCIDYQSDDQAAITHAYQLGMLYEDPRVNRLSKEAILVPEDEKIRSLLAFFETTTQNRGFQVRIFDDRQAALDWLAE